MSKLGKKARNRKKKLSQSREHFFLSRLVFRLCPQTSCFFFALKHRAHPRIMFLPTTTQLFLPIFSHTFFFFTLQNSFAAHCSFFIFSSSILMLFVIPLLLSETDASSRKIIAHCVSSFIHERRSSSAKEHNIHISYILKEGKKKNSHSQNFTHKSKFSPRKKNPSRSCSHHLLLSIPVLSPVLRYM
jgi:hypothetical protein